MVDSINLLNNNVNINSFTSSPSSSSAVDELINDYKESNTLVTDTTTNVKENLYLSSKAQKVSAISSEFFSNGSLNLDDIGALKERAYEFGLISKQEYDKLTTTEFTNNTPQLDEEVSSQTIASFAGNFIQRLNDVISEDEGIEQTSESLIALKEAFIAAQDILSDIEKSKSDPNFKDILSSTLSLIQETVNAESFDLIPLDDKVGITKVYQALDIVDKITPERLSNEKINRYIQISIT